MLGDVVGRSIDVCDNGSHGIIGFVDFWETVKFRNFRIGRKIMNAKERYSLASLIILLRGFFIDGSYGPSFDQFSDSVVVALLFFIF